MTLLIPQQKQSRRKNRQRMNSIRIRESSSEAQEEHPGVVDRQVRGEGAGKRTQQADHRVPQDLSDPGLNDRTTVEYVSVPLQNEGFIGPKHDGLSECSARHLLYNRARAIVRLLKVEQGLKPVKKLPRTIVCGSLRSAIRSLYPPDLTLVQELSVKTVMKVMPYSCKYCSNREPNLTDKWIKERLATTTVDEAHLDRFAKAFRMNVPENWASKRSVYVPNGHATLNNSTCKGGNWNREEYSDQCLVTQVNSSGKVRTVTLFSEYNTSVLTPLHTSLYRHLQRRGWLLVGPPTGSRLRRCHRQNRDWLSYDYIGATDNIKTAYVRRAVEELIRADSTLSDDEIRCLRALILTFDGVEANVGQPMGSAMSFPLLCLINKTVVDLSLAELLEAGVISLKEWRDHPCLINGDDLLTVCTSSGDLNERIVCNGQKIGLRVNTEKTLRHPEYAEINSTVFKNCIKQKKTNVSALWMSADVEDVLGHAWQSTTTIPGFIRVVTNNITRLARSKTKTCVNLCWRAAIACVKNRRINYALCCTSSYAILDTNTFPVEIKSDDLMLTSQECNAALALEVERVRGRRTWKTAKLNQIANATARKAAPIVYEKRSVSFLKKSLKREKLHEERILSCIARASEKKRKDALLAEEGYEEPALIISDLSGIESLLDAIKAWKLSRVGVRPHSEVFPFGDIVCLTDG